MGVEPSRVIVNIEKSLLGVNLKESRCVVWGVISQEEHIFIDSYTSLSLKSVSSASTCYS